MNKKNRTDFYPEDNISAMATLAVECKMQSKRLVNLYSLVRKQQKELNAWKKACELACRGSLDVVRCDTCCHKPETCEGNGEDETCVNGVMTYFYAQAQKELEDERERQDKPSNPA